MSSLQENACCAGSLQEREKVHGSPFSLAARIIELESSIETEKKSKKEADTNTLEMKSHLDNTLEALRHDKETRAKDREAYEGRVAGLRKEVYESLYKNIKRVYGSFCQVANQVEAFCPYNFIPYSQLDPPRVVRDRALMDDVDDKSQGGDT